MKIDSQHLKKNKEREGEGEGERKFMFGEQFVYSERVYLCLRLCVQKGVARMHRKDAHTCRQPHDARIHARTSERATQDALTSRFIRSTFASRFFTASWNWLRRSFFSWWYAFQYASSAWSCSGAVARTAIPSPDRANSTNVGAPGYCHPGTDDNDIRIQIFCYIN